MADHPLGIQPDLIAARAGGHYGTGPLNRDLKVRLGIHYQLGIHFQVSDHQCRRP